MSRILLVASVAALLGCSDAEVAPSAVIVEVAPDTLDPARDNADELTIRLEYADGDADLGGGVAAVHDCRADGLAVEWPSRRGVEEAVDEAWRSRACWS